MFKNLFKPKQPTEPVLRRIDYDDRLLEKNGVITISLNGSGDHRSNMTSSVGVLASCAVSAAAFAFYTDHPIVGAIILAGGAHASYTLLRTIWERIPRVIGAEKVYTFTSKEAALASIDEMLKGYEKVGE